MMRSPRSLSIVCRRRSGELVVRERAAPTLAQGPRTWPLVRGVVTVVESLKLGSQALRWSADLYEQDLDDEDKPKSKKPPSASNVLTALSLPILSMVTSGGEAAPSSGSKGAGGFGFISILFAIGLFVAAPQAGAEGINKLFQLDLDVSSPGFQALTGAAKLLIVVGYMLLIRQVAEIRRVFQYHGAEHKAISTYEAQEELTVENAAKKTTLHARCGTTFLVMVALVSILVFSAIGAFLPTIPGGRLAQSVGFFFMKLPFLPFIAAITYELQRFFARFCTVGPLQVLLWPGFLVQKITTAEPEPAQLEVALASLRATLWREAAAQTAPAEVPDRVFPDYGQLLADPGYVGARV
ncbi:DUF1385 domain-containing protein [Polyangium spumosum]|uniref:DUF1385 domain-containing protein n=2 Tax=Polyangium spumosum TaxID=889282 RepID=A0A6N7PPQ0_9BACT|nr:DUF1385 domain-containing protein [Polyangium spumosum]